MSSLSRLWTAQEVMDHLRITKPTLYKLFREGELRKIQVRGGIRVPEDSLVAYLRRNEAEVKA